MTAADSEDSAVTTASAVVPGGKTVSEDGSCKTLLTEGCGGAANSKLSAAGEVNYDIAVIRRIHKLSELLAEQVMTAELNFSSCYYPLLF